MDNTNQDTLPDDGSQLDKPASQPESTNQLRETSGQAEVITDNDGPQPPPGVRVARNGAWQDEETGRFIAGGKIANAITVDNAAEFHRLQHIRKWESQLAAGAGLAELHPAENELEAWAEMTRAMGEMALSKKGTAAVKAYEAAGKAAGFIGSNGNGSDSGPAPGRLRVTADMDQDQLMEFISNWRAAGQPGSQADGQTEGQE